MVINEMDIYSNFNAHAGIKKIIKKNSGCNCNLNWVWITNRVINPI